MLKDLLKEGGLYTMANLLTKGVSLLLIPFYTSYFTTEDYGVIDVISVFGAMITTIVSLQLNQGMGRYVAEESDINKKRYASTAIFVIVAIYLFVASGLVLFPSNLINFLSTDELVIPTQTFIYSIYATFLSATFYFLGVYMRFLRMVKQFSIMSFMFALANILSMLYLILIKDMGINGIYLSSIIISPIAIVVSLYLLRNHIILYIGKLEFKKMFIYSAPLIPASIAYLLMNTIDRFYIKDLMSFEAVGIYGIAFKFSTVITIVLTGFTMAMNPITFQNYGDKKYKEELSKMLSYFIGLGSLGFLILALFSKETLMVFTNQNYYAAKEIMPILYLTVIISGLGMFSPGINIAKKTIIGALIIIGSAIVNLVLNYFFIIWFDLIGAAISTLIATLMFYIVYYLIAQKYYYVNLNFNKYTSLLLLNFSFVIIGSYILKFNFTLDIIIKVVMIAIYGVLIYRKFFQKVNEKSS